MDGASTIASANFAIPNNAEAGFEPAHLGLLLYRLAIPVKGVGIEPTTHKQDNPLPKRARISACNAPDTMGPYRNPQLRAARALVLPFSTENIIKHFHAVLCKELISALLTVQRWPAYYAAHLRSKKYFACFFGKGSKERLFRAKKI